MRPFPPKTLNRPTNPDGSSKILPRCTLPLTAMRAMDVLITDLTVFEFVQGQLTLTGLMPGTNLEEVRAKTAAQYVEP